MRLTKLDMAKVITQALLGLDKLPNDDHPEAKRLAKRSKVSLEPQHKLACKIFHDKAVNGEI